MRGYENLNYEHNQKLKKKNNCRHILAKWDGEIPCTGRLICNDCGKQLNQKEE